MRDFLQPPALLVNLAGSNFPPVALSVPAKYQFCVDAGVSAAVGFFDDLAVVGLHDHIACSMHVFTSSMRDGMAATGDLSPAKMQDCIDAFAAGYLGRVQQELRLFHGERVGRNQAAIDASMFASSQANH
ncbi:hypothetical protein AAKU55_005069 [Oxalobacteraceae bacterium GrIS 1.11]